MLSPSRQSLGPKNSVATIVQRNIKALTESKRATAAGQSRSHRATDWVARFAGSMPFLILHIVLLGCWIVWNLFPGNPGWDPYPFVFLATVVSVEAIFLSTIVLITQNKMTQEADRRAELDLQVSLLGEHETTRLVQMVEAIVEHLGIEHRWNDLDELKEDLAPEKVLEAIQDQNAKADGE